MATSGGRLVPAAFLAVLSATTVFLVYGLGGGEPTRPTRTADVAGLTSRPVAGGSSATSRPGTLLPTARATPAPPAPPATATPPAPVATPVAPTPAPTGIAPGSVDRASLELTATYEVHAEVAMANGRIDVATTLVVRNDGSDPVDRLELNTIAARLGQMKLTTATVDNAPVDVAIRDQTLIVPLGGVLEPGAGTTVRIAYHATLRNGITGSDWMFSRAGGTLALYRWIPWLSRELPFDRPNHGDPFVTVSSPEVSVEVLTDLPAVLAAPSADVVENAAGDGRDWSFTVQDVRDVSIVLAPDFEVLEQQVGGVTVRAYGRSGTFATERLLSLTVRALKAERRLLGVDYPWPALVAVETQGGYGLESPGLVWIPRNLDTLNRTYIVHHEVAHQWFYGLVGNDQRTQPFADEAAADLLARSVLDSFRPTRCSQDVLDRSIARYSSRCYYEVIYVQGGLLLDSLRREIGAARFWGAIATYLDEHRFGLATTRDLLDAIDGATTSSLRSLLRARFPSLY